MIGGGNMVVSIRLQAPDGILLFIIEVVNETLQEFLSVGHFLKSREETWLSGFRLSLRLGRPHVGVVPNIIDAEPSLGISV